MANELTLNKPQVNVGLVTRTCTIPPTVAGGYVAGGLFNAQVQVSFPQALNVGTSAGSGAGLGAGSGGGALGGFALGGDIPMSAAGSIAASLSDQGVVYTAVNAGVAGNDIAIELVNPGADGALAINVVGKSIIVTLAVSTTITTTAAQLIAALNLDSNASALIVASGSGAVPLTALVTTSLNGGSAAIAASGAGATGQGFGPADSGYQQPPVYVSSNDQGSAVSSALTITVVNTTTSTTYLTSTVPTSSQSFLKFKVPFSPAIANVITITLSSANASDAVLNGVVSEITVAQGFN